MTSNCRIVHFILTNVLIVYTYRVELVFGVVPYVHSNIFGHLNSARSIQRIISFEVLYSPVDNDSVLSTCILVCMWAHSMGCSKGGGGFLELSW